MTQGYDLEYFKDRYPVEKDWLMFAQWIDLLNPKTILSFGDGVGKITYIGRYYDIETYGYDPFVPDEQIIPEIREFYTKTLPTGTYDLVICNDVLEHIRPEATDATIDQLISLVSDGGFLLLSVCDSSLWKQYYDPTHINKHTREWWTYQFVKRGLEQIPIPNNWLFREQLYVFRKVNK